MSSTKTAGFLPLAKLPRAPASDLKKLGWRGIMGELQSKRRLLITNHNEPEAVIVAAAEYDALMRIVEESEAQAKAALTELRKSFDERLSVLQADSAAGSLRSVFRGRVKLGGKVKAPSGY